MECKNEFKKTSIKNCSGYFFDDIMKVEEINIIINILLDNKSYENILVYNILYKKIMDAKALPIRLDKVNGLIKIYNEIIYLELSNSYDIDYRIYNAIFDRINYLISDNVDDKHSINHNFARIRIDLYNSVPREKKFDFS